VKISIVIPVYNCEKWLDQCIESALGQSLVEEIIIVDDGSTDDSLHRCHQWASKTDIIVVTAHQGKAHLGRSATRNLGINLAKSKWIAFLDADDFYYPKRFDHLEDDGMTDGWYDAIKTYYDDSTARYEFNEEITRIQVTVDPKELLNYLILNPEERFSLNGFVIRKKCLIDVGGFDTLLDIGEDTDLIWRLANKFQLSSTHNSAPVAVRRVHGQNSYSDIDSLNGGRYLFYNKWNRIIHSTKANAAARNKILRSLIAYQPFIIKNHHRPILSKALSFCYLFRYKIDVYVIKLFSGD
jgi:glycosyltransferase involved in cell wall biosynthesis